MRLLWLELYHLVRYTTASGAPRRVDRCSGGARESNRPRRKADELRNKTEQERTPPAIVEDCGRTTVLCGDEGSLVVLLSGGGAAAAAAPRHQSALY